MRHPIKQSLCAWLLLAGFAAAPAHALETGRWYGEVAAGRSTTDISVADWNDGSIIRGSVDDGGLAYSVAAGYGFSRHIGIEFNYWRLADTQFNGTSASIQPSVWVPGPVTGRTEAQGVAVEGVAAWPLGQRFTVFAKGGLFFWDTITKYFPTINSQVTVENNQLTIVNDDGVERVYGAGLDVKLYRKWWLRAQWSRSAVGLARTQHYAVTYPSLGLMLYF